jgi:hypothetical protein
MTVSVDGAETSLTVSVGASTVPSGQTLATAAGFGFGITFFGTVDSGTVPAGQVGFGFGTGTHFNGAGAGVASGATDLTTVVTFLVSLEAEPSVSTGNVVFTI